MGWDIIEADCVEAMAAMDEASVDAVVCDPPYGLEFMGKEWDRLLSAPSGSPHARQHSVSFVNPGNPTCRNCGGLKSLESEGSGGRTKCRCERPDFPNHLLPRARAMQEWHEAWAREALRVLKPGGHLLAFGGTRTYHRLACAIEDAGFEIRDTIAWMYGSGFPKSLDVSKAIDAAAGAEREVTATIPDRWAGKGQVLQRATQDERAEAHITAPATPDAERWQGWGTALKPAWESIVVAQKPAGESDIIRWSLWLLVEQLMSLASDAEPSSPSRPAALSEAFASAGWTADEQRSTRAALCEAMGTSRFESALTTSLSIVSSWSDTLDALCTLTSMSTTETATRPTTALRTLKSSLSGLTPRTIIQAATTPDGSGWSALPAAVAFSAVESRLSATRELLAPASATEKSQESFQAADDPSPLLEPIVVARKPLSGTVAATVLEHGTGALNVDGCRIGAASAEDDRRLREWPRPNIPAKFSGWESKSGEGETGDASYSPLGRWPANVVLDPEAAAMLDEQTGTLHGSGSGTAYEHIRNTVPPSIAADCGYGHKSVTVTRFGDSGGASRFFYVGKASSSERSAGLPNGDRSTHPTVKPVALMRWLVRLVTPPDGLVIDPFAGSGTTGIAAILEGFRFVGIEREPEYAAIARARVEWWSRHPDGMELVDRLEAEKARKAVAESGQLGMFDA